MAASSIQAHPAVFYPNVQNHAPLSIDGILCLVRRTVLYWVDFISLILTDVGTVRDGGCGKNGSSLHLILANPQRRYSKLPSQAIQYNFLGSSGSEMVKILPIMNTQCILK